MRFHGLLIFNLVKQICVWCWHHIMDMAEKDQTEGRCPACRTPYNKEKIVGMTANCERLVAEMNMEKKIKSQKTKSKTSEGRKQLSSVRVIQRNLVYVVGLPLNLADEDLLQRREYFGQYGKAMKVSISRTAAGSIQHFANNTCSVYITYSKEEEAVRCIQSVHGFVLDGRSLRACFGTTKYCHAWLRNVACTNPDCLYLHEVGSQEDSFTKDEIISAYTRSRVQQITGATNNMQRRSGNVLPPPADEYYINSSASSGKPINKSASNNLPTSVRGSPPNSSYGQPAALPAAASWGMRASNSQPSSAILACSNRPQKQKPESCSMAFSTAVAGVTQVSVLHGDAEKKLNSNEEGCMTFRNDELESQPDIQYVDVDFQVNVSEVPATRRLPAKPTVNGQSCSPPLIKDKDTGIVVSSYITNSFDPSGPGPDEEMNDSANGNIQNLCSDMASLNVDAHLEDGIEHSWDTKLNSFLPGKTLDNSPQNQGLQQCDVQQFREPLLSVVLPEAVASANDICVAREQLDPRSDSLMKKRYDWRIDSRTQVTKTDSQVALPEGEKDLQCFEDQRLKDPEVTSTSYFCSPSHPFHISHQSRVHSPQSSEPYGSTSYGRDPQISHGKVDKEQILYSPGVPNMPNGYPENVITGSVDSDRALKYSYSLPNEVKWKCGGFEGQTDKSDQSRGIGESSIISNILSMDFDSLDESLASPQNVAKLLGETDRQQGSINKLTGPWKVQNSGQSRFSFAREEQYKNKIFGFAPSLGNSGQLLKDHPPGHDFSENRHFNLDRLGDCIGIPKFNLEESDNFAGSYSRLSSNKLSVSRAQVSAPPGFPVHSRAPPPGFDSNERMELASDAISGNHLLNASSLLRNPYQVQPAGNIGSSGDIEFMDPAILAVGKGRMPSGLNNAASLDMRSNFSSPISAFENESRLQMLMQRSLSPLQHQRFTDRGDGFAPNTDAYGVPSSIMEQTLASNLSSFSQHTLQQPITTLMSNGQWNGCYEAQGGNDLPMAEFLKTERLGFNKLHSGYEDSKFRMPSSGNLYNRMYGF
ncbi:uncharacterized protein LOC127800963 isoform X2 [Diospyros lotus]|uniref:uncharacterized protein LOC127800963 isoform X2 n=1 Tax=Diospyros lotus TaxID=55363 RepID=UPI002250DD62|nr:uncharacterized protein LOC127800963 isoform X2 [Diospyros lotus]